MGLARNYTRNPGSNPPGNPGRTVLGIVLAGPDRQERLYALTGFRGTKRTIRAVKNFLGDRYLFRQVIKEPAMFEEAKAELGVHRRLKLEDQQVFDIDAYEAAMSELLEADDEH